MTKNFSFIPVFVGLAVFAYAQPAAAISLGAKVPMEGRLLVHAADDENKDLVRGAENFIGSLAQRGIDFLSDEKLSHEQRRESFRSLLRDNFDMKTLGRFSLGRYWRVSTKVEREEYLKLFEEMIIDVYSSRFKDYKGQRFDVREARADSENDAIVTSYIKGDTGPEIEVQWRVRYKDNRYKVVDVIVEGVSMAVTQRSDFASVIQRGGGNIEVLLAHLRQEDIEQP